MSREIYAKESLPKLILPDLLWSLSEPVPSSTDEMEAALSSYAALVKEALDRGQLGLIFPRLGMDLRFSIWRRPSEEAEWQERPLSIPLRFTSLPTYLLLVLEVHKATHAYLKDDDKHYFEGLELMASEGTDQIPAYYLCLGS